LIVAKLSTEVTVYQGVQTSKLKDLTADKRNANKGTERGGEMVENSLRSYGAGRSILLDKHGNIIAGNKTAEGAAAIGLEDVIVVKTDGKTLVAVQRTDLDLTTDRAAKELAIADNRAGQVSLNWDTDVLRDLSSGDDGVDLTKFWTSTEMEALFPVDAGGSALKDMEQDDDLRYQVVIDCQDEAQQTSLLDRLEREGLKCKPLIS
jgi:hypothetical protein